MLDGQLELGAVRSSVAWGCQNVSVDVRLGVGVILPVVVDETVEESLFCARAAGPAARARASCNKNRVQESF